MRRRRASLRPRWLGAGGWGTGWGGVAAARRSDRTDRAAGRMACGADGKGSAGGLVLSSRYQASTVSSVLITFGHTIRCFAPR